MAASFEFNEDNGTATGSPAAGTTRTTAVTQVNWKNTDDVATSYSSSPIVAGTNSYTKYQSGKFTGTFTQISAGLFAHTSGTLGVGLTLKGTVTSTYATPSTATNAALTTNMTTPIAIASGLTVLFNTTPQAATPTATLGSAGFTQFLATQLQTTVSTVAGDTAIVTLTLQYDES